VKNCISAVSWGTNGGDEKETEEAKRESIRKKKCLESCRKTTVGQLDSAFGERRGGGGNWKKPGRKVLRGNQSQRRNIISRTTT